MKPLLTTAAILTFASVMFTIGWTVRELLGYMPVVDVDGEDVAAVPMPEAEPRPAGKTEWREAL